jgi:hypothetical protein
MYVYGDMTAATKEKLAEQISEIQNKVATLQFDNGIGWELGTVPGAERFEQLRGMIKEAGVFSPGVVDVAESGFTAHRAYFDGSRPTAFLDDMQGKNIIINDRRELSGIVDADTVAYGDRLSCIGLARMALWTKSDPIDYINALCRGMGVAGEREALRLYTMYFCVDFMSEIGRAFNQDPVEAAPARVEKLNKIFSELCSKG